MTLLDTVKDYYNKASENKWIRYTVYILLGLAIVSGIYMISGTHRILFGIQMKNLFIYNMLYNLLKLYAEQSRFFLTIQNFLIKLTNLSV